MVMSTKAMNFKMDENDINDLKGVAAVYNMTVTEIIKEALKEYVEKLKEDPFYRLSVNVKEASAEESAEIIDDIKNLSDDDLTITTSKKITV